MIRHAAGLSPEELSLLDAFQAGNRAGILGVAAGLCPYSPDTEEAKEWNRGRTAAIGIFLAHFAEAR